MPEKSDSSRRTGATEFETFVLENESGMRVQILEYGAILASLVVPDRDGIRKDVTLGYDSPAGWMTNTEYLGATVGRFGNRIAKGRFSLDGTSYALATNDAPGGMPCHLHGGTRGFDKVFWRGEKTERGVRLSYTSPAGEEGYPGTLEAVVTYELTDDDRLIWRAVATTDAPTIVNLVHHSYWNLSGDPSTSINDHELVLSADRYLPTNAGLIPTGERAPVHGTPMDFTTPAAIGSRVDADFEALRHGSGYDHAWVLNGGESQSVRPAAELYDAKTGREMRVSTNQPAIHFYGGNFLDGQVVGKRGVQYEHRCGLALETENFPDAPNQPTFPSAILRPGETYEHVMIHEFSTR